MHINSEGSATLPDARIEAGVRLALEQDDVHEAEVSVSFLDDAGIREMNREHLGRDRVTDVIAFTMDAGPRPLVFGDVYIGLEQAERQAQELGIPGDEELVRLAIHGTLHVLGHDHPEGEGREESDLFRRQESLVRAVMAGSADPPDEQSKGHPFP